jgi:ubiquinol-cytochrome c reductase cytochrome c subunit
VNVNGADIALGRELYILNCASCHGAAGSGGAVGGGFVAPSLHESDPLTVAEAVTAGPGPMPRFVWDQHELDAIAAYVHQLRTMPNPGGLAVTALGPVPEGFVAIFVGLVAMVALVRWIGRRGEVVHPAEPPNP